MVIIFRKQKKPMRKIQPNTAAEIYAKSKCPCCATTELKTDETMNIPHSATFDAHMKALADSGYHSISPINTMNTWFTMQNCLRNR